MDEQSGESTLQKPRPHRQQYRSNDIVAGVDGAFSTAVRRFGAFFS